MLCREAEKGGTAQPDVQRTAAYRDTWLVLPRSRSYVIEYTYMVWGWFWSPGKQQFLVPRSAQQECATYSAEVDSILTVYLLIQSPAVHKDIGEYVKG